MAPRERLSGVDDIRARAPRIGKLKIGEVKEKKTAKGVVTFPSKLDYIIAKDGGGNRVEAFHAIYGDKPVSFMAVFPTNDPADWYWEAYRRYGSGTGLACHGDGHRAVETETGEEIDCPCHFAESQNDKPPVCKVTVSLSLWLYEVPELGLFQIDTSGFQSMSNIKWFVTQGLPSLSGGQLAGIPIRVYIEPFQATHDGKTSTAFQWKMGLAPGMKPQDVRIAAQKAVEGFVLPVGDSTPMLDESKPEDLYAGLPPAEEEPAPVEVPEKFADIAFDPDEVAAEEETVVSEEPVVEDEQQEKDDNKIPRPFGPQVQVQEDRLLEAMGSVAIPETKMKQLQNAIADNRSKADSTGNWENYIKWLDRQSKSLEGMAKQGSLT